ncbi:hypothetical protein GIB67_009984 [Kingdonia uniflora]|uniref:Uncharacterized protein n=1 Tax=Kingdonia uniflora TaxID=39325 RepID=A0A7J7L925_9MAGN|nr:hypothetical protein GIB67_009984 [Kingdonia uniflora]
MVKSRRKVLEERIASKIQRLNLKYFRDHSLENATLVPVLPTYQRMSKNDTVEDEEFCTTKASLGGRWGNCIEYADRQFRGCTVPTGEEYFYLLADLAKEKGNRGIDKSRSLEYFDGNVQSELLEGFLCCMSLLEYDLSLPLCNLAKGIINLIGACPVQMNGNIYEVISVYESLNTRWEGDGRRRRISYKDLLQFYGSDDEEPIKLLLRTVKQTPKSQMVRKESLLDIVAQKETELEAVLEELGISRKKRINRLAALHREEEMSKMAAHLMKGICLGVEEERAELKWKKVELERNVA